MKEKKTNTKCDTSPLLFCPPPPSNSYISNSPSVSIGFSGHFPVFNSEHSPVSEDTAQYSALISCASLMASCSIWEYWAGDCQRDQRRQVRHTYVIQLNTKGIATRGQLIISVTLYLEIYNKQTEHCWWLGPPHINKQYEIVLFIKISLFIQSWKCTEFVYLCINKSVYEALSLLIILSPQKLQNAPLITNFFFSKNSKHIPVPASPQCENLLLLSVLYQHKSNIFGFWTPATRHDDVCSGSGKWSFCVFGKVSF